MKILEDKRNRCANNYIIISQVLFFLLVGILLIRVTHFSYDKLFVKMPTIIVLALLLALIPLLNLINYKQKHKSPVLDFMVVLLYLFITGYLLTQEPNSIFKVTLLMPVVIYSIKYGVKGGAAAAVMTSAALFVITKFSGNSDMDANVLMSALFFLIGWLTGKMTDTEKNIRSDLEKLASHDSLTEIYNHRSFQHLLDKELKQAKSINSSVSLLMIDIDYFKVYNDTYGHSKGDQVLKKIAHHLQQTVGSLGYCARYGGEEFAIILPGLPLEKAKIMGERIRKIIYDTRFPGGELLPGGRLTVSVGIAEYPGNADSKEKLLQNADEALYRAKFVSKNKVETYYSVFDELSFELKDNERELFNSIKTLTMVINAKDRYTYGHSLRVMELAKSLAEKMGLDKQTVKDITYGAMLHDIGKIEVSREILNKPSKLSNEEWQILKQHPRWGADIVRPLKSIKGAVDVILYHHENFDGSGYPHGLKGKEIPIGARILRVVDSFDSMCTNRPYKNAMSKNHALEELDRYCYKFYDPEIVKFFKDLMSNYPEY